MGELIAKLNALAKEIDCLIVVRAGLSSSETTHEGILNPYAWCLRNQLYSIVMGFDLNYSDYTILDILKTSPILSYWFEPEYIREINIMCKPSDESFFKGITGDGVYPCKICHSSIAPR